MGISPDRTRHPSPYRPAGRVNTRYRTSSEFPAPRGCAIADTES